jgi:hypothetical protein
LGDKLIHIKFAPICPTDDEEHYRGRKHSCRNAPGHFGYILCEANVSEQEAYELCKSKDYEESDESKEPGRDKRLSSNRHAACYSCWDDGLDCVWGTCDKPRGGPKDGDRLERNRLPLAILRVCRQAYVEINPIFWRTSTWSFTHCLAFYKFMYGRNAVQKRLMSKLHLDYDMTSYIPPIYREDWTSLAPNKANKANKAMLQKFPALELLHLDAKSHPDSRYMAQFFELWPIDDSVFDGLSEFQFLPLKTVTVICMDTFSPDFSNLSRTENLKLAEHIRLQLLDYQGAGRERRAGGKSHAMDAKYKDEDLEGIGLESE